MSAHSHPSPPNGGSRANLFIDDDHEEQPVRAGAAPARRRGRGLVVPLEEPAPASDSRAARFTRPDRGLGGLVTRARNSTRSVDRNDQDGPARVATQRYGRLIAVTVVVGVLLAISWLGLALRTTADARDEARQQRHTTSVALDRSRDRVRILIAERDRARAAAGTAQSQRNARTAAATARARDPQQLKRERQRRRGRDRRG
jgi:hypothetical protein